MTIEPHFTNIQLITRETGISEHLIEYRPGESYASGLRNCCYRMIYYTPEGLYAIDFRCGCERQTVPDGSLQSLYVSKM